MSQTYDVVIVGSGPEGATYARELRDASPATRILMVEAGPIVSTPPGRHVRTITDARERVEAQFASQGPHAHPADYEAEVARALSPSRGRSAGIVARPGTWLLGADVAPGEDGFPAAALSSNVGGMGAHWSGASPTPGAGEISPDVDPAAFDRALGDARRHLRVTQRAFEGAPLGDDVRRLLGAHYDAGRPADRRVQPMPLAMDTSTGSRYWTAPGVVLGDLLDGDPAFELRPETVARRVLTRGSVIDGVLLYDRREDREYEVGAQHVVVAADSLRSPQLLHASDIRPPALGHYLNEHTMVTCALQLDPSLRPPRDARRASEGAVDVLAGVSWVPYFEPDFVFHGQVTQWDASPIPIDPSLEVWPGSIVECSVFMGKADVRYEDRLEFDDDRLDYLGMPAIGIHYTFTTDDRARLDGAIAEAERMASLLGEPLGDSGPVVMPHGASLHYQGTTRIGTDPETSTADPSSRVWGVDGLYVAGNGLVPTPAACNPTLTNVAFAVLGARDLAGRI